MQKVSSFVFCFFWWLCFFYSLCVFVFLETAPKRLFSCNFRVVFFFCVPKRPLKSFFLYSVLFPCFLLSSLSKFHNFSLAFVHQPLFGKYSFFFFCLFLPLPLFLFVFLSNKFPNIPFLKPKLVSFCALFLITIFCMVYVSAFLFWCWFCLCYVFL